MRISDQLTNFVIEHGRAIKMSNSEEAEDKPLDLSPTSVQRVRTVSKTCFSPNGSFKQEIRAYVGDDMDRYLGERGFVKRIVPKDSNSLYRCISELLCLNQVNFLPIKNAIEDHVQLHYKLQQIENAENVVDRTMDRLIAASTIYKIKIVIYRGKADPQIVGENYERELTMCEVTPNCYERVYRKDLQLSLAITQTFLYQCFYENVIKVPREVIIEAITHVRYDIDSSGKDPTTASTPLPGKTASFTFCGCTKVVQGYRPPIPYSAVKSLDPAIYRNIAYDLYAKDKRRAVLDEKKENERKSDDRFPVGSACMARDGKDILRAKVISILPDNHRCIRFDNGTEKNVIASDLRAVVAQVITTCSNEIPVEVPIDLNSYNIQTIVPVAYKPIFPSPFIVNSQPTYQPLKEKKSENIILKKKRTVLQSKDDMDRHDVFHVGNTCLLREGNELHKVKIIAKFPDSSRCVRFENGVERKVSQADLTPLPIAEESILPEFPILEPISNAGTPTMHHYPINQGSPFPPGFSIPPLNMSIPPPPIVKHMPSGRVMSTPKPSSSYYVPAFDPNIEKTTWWQPTPSMQCNQRFSVGHRPLFGTGGPIVVRKMEASSMPTTPLYPTPPPGSDRDMSSVFASPVRSPAYPKKAAPYIDREKMLRVNQTVDFSKKEDGTDLPEDVLTLRYFYNLGVMTYRNGYDFMNSSLDRESNCSAFSGISIPPPSTIPLPVFPEQMSMQFQPEGPLSLPFDCSVPPPLPPMPQHQVCLPSAPVRPENYARLIPMSSPMPVCVNGTFYFNPPVVNS
ncbi:unnamed protein product [Auanema sp. JU1783]|nr:unnamed protein product [Auanema sp. JU1783]